MATSMHAPTLHRHADAVLGRGIRCPASAQQPTSVNPTAQSVKEQELLKELQKIQGRSSLPDTRTRVLEQPEGRNWRQFHQVTLRWIAAIAILGMLAVLIVFYLIRGMVRIENGRSGRTLVRFNAFERFVHWMTASCFIVLAISGLNITFGKELLTPLDRPGGVRELVAMGQVRAQLPELPLHARRGADVPDVDRLEFPTRRRCQVDRGGRRHRRQQASAGAAVQCRPEAIYWVVVLGGGAAAITGYLLMFPFYATDVSGMQTAQMVHGIVGVLFIAIMLAHIYIGTIGMQGAFEAMGKGEVDVNWARQHHSLWLEKEAKKGHVRGGGVAPAE